jgi:uncharacterized membrane protein
MPTAFQDTPDARILQTLEAFDRRLQAIEQRLDLAAPDASAFPPASSFPPVSSFPAAPAGSSSPAAPAALPREAAVLPARESLEFTIGRNWLPKLGVTVFTLGMIFLLTLPLGMLPALVADTLGFVVAGLLMLLSRYFSKSMPQFSRYMTGGAMLLLFFSTMRMHFFSESPVIADGMVVFALLLGITAFNLLLSLRSSSPWLVALSLGMGCAAVLAAPSAWLVLSGNLAIAAVTVVIVQRRGWPYLLMAGLVFVTFTHFLWGIHNPFFTSTAMFVSDPFAHFLFILVYPLVFGMAAWSRAEATTEEENGRILSALLNTALPLVLLFALSMSAAPESVGGLHLALAVIHIGLAQAFWIRAHARYATFFYTMAGNLALSIAILATFSIPTAFLWLCLQSFLVISLGVWFRSRFIVVANFGIFLMILLGYLVTAKTIDGTLMMFGIVALLSARIMNWQKDRLELKADVLRSSYLITALFVIPYALHHMLPGAWVSLSWAGVAIAYYALGKLLDNLKYRWMAIATLLMAVLHLMIVGTTSFEPAYRTISFIVLGVVLLAVSLWYLKTTGKSNTTEHTDDAAAS